MARPTTWQSSLWARWLGWTVLYALVVHGASLVEAFTQKQEIGFFSLSPIANWHSPLSDLVAAVLALVIGVRFRSWWWGLGPLLAFSLPAVWAARLCTLTPSPVLEHDQCWGVVFAMWFMVYGALASLIGLAGVWWGKHREARTSGSTASSLTGDASP